MPKRSLEVRLRIRAKDACGKWVYYAPTNKRGTLDKAQKPVRPFTPLYALVDGTPRYRPEGLYYLLYIEDRLQKAEGVGNDLNVALTAQTKCRVRLLAKASGIQVVKEPTRDSPLADAINDWIAFIGEQKSHKTYLAYNLAMTHFRDTCKKPTSKAIVRQDIINFINHLRERNLGPRTVSNLVFVVKRFMLSEKCAWPLDKADMPRYTERIPTAYALAQLLDLVKNATQDERDLIAFLTQVGVREQEVEYACWTDFDFHNLGFRVQEKPNFPKFKVKGGRERTVPIPEELVPMMEARRKRYPTSRLVFPTAKGEPNGHLLRIIKVLALKAGLNCETCYTRPDKKTGEVKCCDKHPVCKRWTLHDFRRTYSTILHANGATVYEIQENLGHQDVQTTMHYLASAVVRSDRAKKAINTAFPGLSELSRPTA